MILVQPWFLRHYFFDWAVKKNSFNKILCILFLVQKDACGQINSGPACCTYEVMNSYASSLGDELKTLFDSELIHLTRIFSIAKQQTDGK